MSEKDFIFLSAVVRSDGLKAVWWAVGNSESSVNDASPGDFFDGLGGSVGNRIIILIDGVPMEGDFVLVGIEVVEGEQQLKINRLDCH